jgi:hypothetical protein
MGVRIMKKLLFKFLLMLICLGFISGLMISCATNPPGPPPPAKVMVNKPLKPFPGAKWVQGHWVWKHGRWVWINGYWK